MDFYNTSESYESYEVIRNHERQVIENLTKTHPVFNLPKPVRNPDSFSNLSAEERWSFSKRINDLQKLINEIQTDENAKISSPGFTLEEVLEVLNVRRAMHNKNRKIKENNAYYVDK